MKIFKGVLLLSLVSVLLAANTLPLREVRSAFLLPAQLPPYASSTLLNLIFYSGAGKNYVFNTQLQSGELLFPQMAASCENSSNPSTSSRFLMTGGTFSYYYCYALDVIYVLDFYQDFAIIDTLKPSLPLRANSVLAEAGLNDSDFVVILSWDQTGSELIYINETSNVITNDFHVSGTSSDPLVNIAILNTTNFVATGRTSSTSRNIYIFPFFASGSITGTLLTNYSTLDSFLDQLTTSYTRNIVEFVSYSQGTASLNVYSMYEQEVIGSVIGIEVVNTTYNNMSWSQGVFSPSFESDNFYVFYQGSLAVFNPNHVTLTPISQTPLPYFSSLGAINNAQMYVVSQNTEQVYLQLGNYLYTTTNVNVTSINLYPSSNIFYNSFIYGSNFSFILTQSSILTYNNAGQFVYANFMNYTNFYKDNLAPQYFWYLSTSGVLYQYNLLTNTNTVYQSFPGNNYQFVANNINGTVAGISNGNGFLSCNKKNVFNFNLHSVPGLPTQYSRSSQVTLFPNCGPTPKVVVIVVGCNFTTCSNPIAVEFNSTGYDTYFVEKDSSSISQMDANTLIALENDYLNGNTIAVFNPFTFKYSFYQANVADVLLVNAFAYPVINGGAYVYYVYQDDLENVYFGITSQYIQYQTLLSQPNEFSPMITKIMYSGAGTNSFTISQTGLYTAITYYQIISL